MSNTSQQKKELYEQAQRALVASLVYDGAHAVEAFEVITTDDIQEPSLALIIDAIGELVRTDTPISQISIAKRLEAVGHLEKAGGFPQINELYNEGKQRLLDHKVLTYANIVRESSVKNQIKTTLDEFTKLFQDDSGVEASDAVADLQSMLNEQLYRLSNESTTVDIAEGVEEYFELLEERKRISEENAKDASGLQGIPTMLPTLNKITTGWLPGQMITVGARTGIGKSVFAVNSAVAACQAGKSVLFFSLEMSSTEIEDRIFASMSNIPMNKMKLGDLDAQERKVLEETGRDVAKMKLLVETEPKITIDAIRAKALKRAQSEAGLDLIVIDYLQLITPSSRHNSRQEEVADISRNVKLLSKQLNVPIMVLVQLNRQGNEDEDAMPAIHHIRESGSIGQDSDIVILLHRDKGHDGEIHDTLVKIEKHRNGEPGQIIRCRSNLHVSLFTEAVKAKDIDEDDDDLLDLNDDFNEFDEFADDFDLDV